MKGSGRGKAGGALMIVGAILLIAGALLPWYALSESGAGTTFTTSLTAYNVQYSCSGSACSFFPSGSHSYSDSHLNKTYSQVVIPVLAIAVLALVFGLIAGVMMLRGRSGGATRGLAVLALILAILAPIYQLAVQPSAVNSDLGAAGNIGGNNTGPGHTFFGSASSSVSGTSITFNWGPSVSWYLAIVAFVLFLVGMILGRGGAAPTGAPMGAPGAEGAAGGGMGGGTMGATSANYCAQCNMSFNTPEELQAHAKAVHGM